MGVAASPSASASSTDPELAPSPPPDCDAGTDLGVCGCLELGLFVDVPNLYFVMDRSGSMQDGNKWSTVRSVVGGIVQRMGPRANFGAAVFPSTRSADPCAPGIEVFAPRQGDSPAGVAGPTTVGLLAATNVDPHGGTPTAVTLASLAPSIAALPGRTFVVLATDGGPNCNVEASCGVDKCIPNIESAAEQCQPNKPPNCCDPSVGGPANCLDEDATVRAVDALKLAGIPTYVVGIPGSGPYSALLDRVATAGGTARDVPPYYYRVDSVDRAAFDQTLSQVAARATATCVIPLGKAPPDPDRVNVYLDGVVVPGDRTNGWVLDGTTVTLVGDTCDRVLSGEALGVRVVAGCPTVKPK